MTSTREIEGTVTDLVAKDIAAMGYELVRVQLTPGGRYLTLQVMAERGDRKPMTVEDCAKISRALSPKLDKAEQLEGRYTLEISSPGIERPLVKVQDFARFTGHMARIELETPLDGKTGGQRRFEGSIVRVTGNAPDAEIELKTETGELRVPANTIAKAKLVPADTRPAVKGSTKH
jgi:ribosome maturation factor RimP